MVSQFFGETSYDTEKGELLRTIEAVEHIGSFSYPTLIKLYRMPAGEYFLVFLKPARKWW